MTGTDKVHLFEDSMKFQEWFSTRGHQENTILVMCVENSTSEVLSLRKLLLFLELARKGLWDFAPQLDPEARLKPVTLQQRLLHQTLSRALHLMPQRPVFATLSALEALEQELPRGWLGTTTTACL